MGHWQNCWLSYISIASTSTVPEYTSRQICMKKSSKRCYASNKKLLVRTNSLNIIVKLHHVPFDLRKTLFGPPLFTQVTLCFHKMFRFSAGPNFAKFCVEIISIDHQICKKTKKNMWCYVLVVFIVTLCWGPLSNIQFQPGSRLMCPLCHATANNVPNRAYISHGLFCSHAYHNYTLLGHTVVMNTWNVDVRQRQTCYIWVVLCYFMPVLN